MAYVSLYRKYRPQTFADVMGQEHVTRTLQNAIRASRIGHGYLFTGTRGTAKTTVARLLAKALNCERGPAPEPCNQCDACTSITNGSCIDVIEMDAASHRGVGDIEEVRKAVGYGPMQFRSKVFIIDEAHQLSADAKDAFLKTLEEPPANVVFILATTEPQSIPITIRSRCQQFDFKRGSLQDIGARLRFVLDQENISHAPEAVSLVARNAEGSWRDALSLLEQVLAFAPEHLSTGAVETVLGTLDAEMIGCVVEVIARADAPEAFALAGRLLDAGKEARTLLRTLSAHFRDLLLVSVGGPAVAQELMPEEVVRLQEQARRFQPHQMMRAMDLLNEAQSETRWNNQHRLLVELTFLKLMDLGAAGADTTFATAPIVFPAAALPAPAVVDTPPAPAFAGPQADTRPAQREPVSLVSVSPAPGPVVMPEKPEDLPAQYFAPDDPADADDEDAFDPFANEPDRMVAVVAEPEENVSPPFDEPSKAQAPGTSADPEPLPPVVPSAPTAFVRAPSADRADATQELKGVMTPGRALQASSSGQDDIPAANPGVTVERVMQVWSRFLQEAERISKQASVMMGSAVPTSVSGGAVTVTFSTRSNYEMMSLPKKQEFVRKLLARCLDLDTISVRFVLDINAPPPRPVGRSKPRQDRDLLAALEQTPRSPAERDGFATSSAFVSAAAAPAPLAPVPFLPAAPTSNNAVTTAPTASQAAALEEPLVQEALSIFGGEIVDES